ncbi:hypothetical protein T439DRAFT_323193 [Meredithblackwellia eburnea MCA 4105]
MRLGKIHIPFTRHDHRRTSDVQLKDDDQPEHHPTATSSANRRRTRSASQPPPSRSVRNKSDQSNTRPRRNTVKPPPLPCETVLLDRPAETCNLAFELTGDHHAHEQEWDHHYQQRPSGEYLHEASHRQWGWLDEPYRPLPLDSPSLHDEGDHDVPAPPVDVAGLKSRSTLFRSFTSRNRSLRQLYRDEDGEGQRQDRPPLPASSSMNEPDRPLPARRSSSHSSETRTRRRSLSLSTDKHELVPPSTPTIRRISTCVDLEGHRVLSSRRRRSASVDNHQQAIPLPPSPVRRLKTTFGVGDEEDDSESSEGDIPHFPGYDTGTTRGLYSCSFDLAGSSQSCTSSPSVPPSDIFDVLSPQAMESDSGGSIFSFSNHGHSSSSTTTTCHFPLATSPYSLCNSATTRSLPAALGATPSMLDDRRGSTSNNSNIVVAPRFLRRKSTTAISSSGREKPAAPPVLGIVARRGSIGQSWKVGTEIPSEILDAEAREEAVPTFNRESLGHLEQRPVGHLQLTNPDAPPRLLRRLSSSASMNGVPRTVPMREAFVGWAL